VGALIYIVLALILRIEEIHLLRAAFVDGWQRLTRAKRTVIIASSEEIADRE
jgi:hypothetical protein